MARCAVRSDDQSLLQESFAVNALREILEDMILVDDPGALDGRSFLVAFAAQVRNLEGRDRRISVGGGKYLMCTVAIPAAGSERISRSNGFAVQ
jgi:hypothetical protein